jgi:SNF2 family DNA or RNA helicase
MPLIVQYERPLLAKHAGFAYQVAAVEALKDLPYGAVFHEQGLGKTKIAIDLALYWLTHDVVDSVLIITKKGLIKNWTEELAQHTHLQPRILSQDRKANFYAFNSPARVYLAHYEVARSSRKKLELFLKTRRVAAILDEAHRIKNPTADITEALLTLAPGFTRRIILTGTPVANRPFDLWAPISFLDGGQALGADYNNFKSSLDLRNDFHRRPDLALNFERTLAGVYDRIRPFAVRETKNSSGIELPTKDVRNFLVELEGRQGDLYREFRDELSAVVVKAGRVLRDNADEMLKRLLRLVQVASNPTLVDQSYSGTPNKFPVLKSLIEDAVDREEKTIVWTAFTENVDWLARELADFNPVRIHGKMGMPARESSVTRFKTEPDCKLLIATPASAKEGLTLTVANNAIFYDRSFSLDDYLQAQDRIHRISQKKPCTITNLIAAGTVDVWVDVLLAAKQLAAQLGQGDITAEAYTSNSNYAYGAMLSDVLGIDDGDDHEHDDDRS